MRKVMIYLVVFVIILVGCGGDSTADDGPSTSSGDAEPVEAVEPEPSDAEPVEAQEPVEADEDPAAMSADDMVGIWEGTVAGEKGYVMYTADGRYLVALVQDDLATAPRVSGEYWFEDGQIHLRDLENAGHWTVCDAETVGVYEVAKDDGGLVKFQTVDDGCDEGGFTRNYIFANMMQERIADAVE